MAGETDRKVLNRGYGIGATDSVEIDAGLRQYMLRVYNYMASGLFLSGLVALLVANTSARDLFFQVSYGRVGYTGLGWIAAIAPLGFILVMNFGVSRMKASTLQFLYWAFVATMGASLASIFMVYSGVSITQVFLVTAISFGGLSLYGYLTKRDLSGMATFLLMGLIGLVVASLVGIFVHSAMLQFVISVVGVLLFAALTAYDTQRIKSTYFSVSNDTAIAEKSAVMGAVALYLDFLNMFLFLLRLFGGQRN